MNEEIILEVPQEADKLRLDKWLSEQITDLTRTALQNLIENGGVLVNGKTVAKNYKQKSGDSIKIIIPEPVELNTEPEDIPLDIVYEDESLLVVNKPKGMVVHPA
ncbi:MAG: RNA pseudouridine synthase, partial [Oscillospiraceae bacterium]|nr:RNA pseudouridine synthase [Oscillospiraceae bacterium]